MDVFPFCIYMLSIPETCQQFVCAPCLQLQAALREMTSGYFNKAVVLA
jgi:hypothetical protein